MIAREDVPDVFSRCFSDSQDSTARNILKIICERGSRCLTERCIKKHRIVPLAWLKENGLIGGEDNLVYLTPRDSLRVHVLMYHYFHRHGDFEMKTNTLSNIRQMQKECYVYLTNFGDVPEFLYERYQEKIMGEFHEVM